MTDWIAVAISFVYVFAALGLAEGLRRLGRYSPDFTRKFVHIAVGMWAWGTVYLFQSRWFAVIPPLVFILLNTISYRHETFKAIESEDKSNLGTIYFPLSFSVIVLLLWDWPQLVVASLMPMAWGDAMASILGSRYGRRRYMILGQRRSLEGSAGMFLFGLLSTFLALWLISPASGFWPSLSQALLAASVATAVEAVSPWGLDNLTVPFASALTLWLLIR